MFYTVRRKSNYLFLAFKQTYIAINTFRSDSKWLLDWELIDDRSMV